MTCPRCQGLMVGDLSCDLAETQGMWVKTLRCMNCGHVTDPTIEKHRLQSNRPTVVSQTILVGPYSQLYEPQYRSSTSSAS